MQLENWLVNIFQISYPALCFRFTVKPKHGRIKLSYAVFILGEVQKAVAYEESVMNEIDSVDDKSLLQNIFLFNITADPYERNDLSKVSQSHTINIITMKRIPLM